MLQELAGTVEDYIDAVENLVEEDKKRHDENRLFDGSEKAAMVRQLFKHAAQITSFKIF